MEVASETDNWTDVVQKIDTFHRHGATYAVAINPYTHAIYEVGKPPSGLAFDFESVIDA